MFQEYNNLLLRLHKNAAAVVNRPVRIFHVSAFQSIRSLPWENVHFSTKPFSSTAVKNTLDQHGQLISAVVPRRTGEHTPFVSTRGELYNSVLSTTHTCFRAWEKRWFTSL